MRAGCPEDRVEVPDEVLRLASGLTATVVWRNELDGLTFALAEPGESAPSRFVKWAPAGSGLDLASEVARLEWLVGRAVVPRLLDHGTSAEGDWIVTAALPGRSAVDPRWCGDPAPAVAAIGAGLRAFHDSLPVESCPFSWRVADRVADARRRRDLLDPRRWDPIHQHLTVDGALTLVAETQESDLVVCHGDACAPNTLIADDGTWTGHVDLGALGIADRWADLAIATWSTEWNYGPGWERHLLDAYGIGEDPLRTAAYRLLWDLGP